MCLLNVSDDEDNYQYMVAIISIGSSYSRLELRVFNAINLAP